MAPSEKGPLTLAELDGITVDKIAGVGEKRKKDLADLDVKSVLDLLMHYPRRWVDRTNECRVRDLVEGAGGEVRVTSTAGVGTSVHVWVPLRDAG
jgi:ATP-dependent DNA helicase RecG